MQLDPDSGHPRNRTIFRPFQPSKRPLAFEDYDENRTSPRAVFGYFYYNVFSNGTSDGFLQQMILFFDIGTFDSLSRRVCACEDEIARR